MNETDSILDEIEAFLARSGMKASTFGIRCMANPMFVFRLRAGSDPRWSSCARVRRFIADHESQAAIAEPAQMENA